MTKEEFRSWISYHTGLFPTLQAKLEKNPGIPQKWSYLLSSVSLEEAKLVTASMSDGSLEPPAAYEWDRLPAMVLQEVRANQTRTSTESEPYQKSRGESNLGAAFQAFVDAQDEGKSLAECKEAMNAVMGPMNERNSARYKCLHCCDTGLVSVWSNYSIRSLLAGRIEEKGEKRGMTCPCSCYLGGAYVREDFANSRQKQEWKGWTNEKSRFSKEVYAELDASRNPDSEESLALLEQFVERLKAGQTEHSFNGLSLNSTKEWEY